MGLAWTKPAGKCAYVCVCAALNKWPMTHNKNYYEWTRTRKTHWAAPSLCLLHPFVHGLERIWIGDSMNADAVADADVDVKGRTFLTTDCRVVRTLWELNNLTAAELYWPLCTQQDWLQSQGTCIKIQLGAIEYNIKNNKNYLIYIECYTIEFSFRNRIN